MAVNRLTLIRPEFTLLRSASAQSQPRDLEVFTEFRRGLKERDRCRATDLGRLHDGGNGIGGSDRTLERCPRICSTAVAEWSEAMLTRQ